MDALFSLFSNGGPVMLPLLVISMLIWGIIIYRFFQLQAQTGNPYALACKLVALYHESGTQACRDFLTTESSWLASRLEKWLDGTCAQPLSGIMLEMRERVYQPGKGLLRALLQAAPLLGLLGTVAGMMETFEVLSSMGIASPAPLSGGIAQALITTQAGLSIALAGILGASLLERAARIRMSAVDRAELVLSSLQEDLT